jgi:hypothetical protein
LDKSDLAFLAFGGGRQCDDAKNSRAHAFGDGFDSAALAGTVAPFEDDADLHPVVDHPLLELDELCVQAQLFVVLLGFELPVAVDLVILAGIRVARAIRFPVAVHPFTRFGFHDWPPTVLSSCLLVID